MSPALVNQPMDEVTKEKDVDRKLQFYGVAQAFQAGKVPSNEQIDVALNSFLTTSILSKPPSGLSTEGLSLIADFRVIIEQAKHLLLSKNEGDVIQDFLWQSHQVKADNFDDSENPVGAESIQQHSQKALNGIKTLGTLILSNGQFRKLLGDASILLRDVASETAQNLASHISPGQEELSQLDKPSANNTWQDVSATSGSDLKDRVRSSLKPNTPKKGEFQILANRISQTSHSEDSRNQFLANNRNKYEQQIDSQTDVNQQLPFQDTEVPLKDQASSISPEEKKKLIHELHERAKNHVSDKLPEDYRNQTTARLKKLVLECQEQDDYQKAIITLLDLSETYAGYANKLCEQRAKSNHVTQSNDALSQAEADLKTLVERFANGTSTKALFTQIDAIYTDAEKDPDLKGWLKQLNSFIRKCLQQQGFIAEDVALNEWNEIFDRGKFLLRDRYRNHIDQLVNEIKLLADQFDQDPQNKRFAQAMQKFFNNLGQDQNGAPALKPQLIKDLTEVILPILFENIRYLPIPRIEYSDHAVDLIVENLVLESDNFFPNIFELTNDNYFRWGREGVSKEIRHSATLHVAGIQMDLKDVAFYLKKKRGFPSIHDIGIVDIFLGGSGFSFTMKLSTSDSMNRENFFKVDQVDVDIKDFKIKIKQSQHRILFTIAKPVLMKVIKPTLQKALELNIMENFRRIDSILYQIKVEVDRATLEAKKNPERAKSIYHQYLSVIQKNLFQNREKTEVVTSENVVNMTFTKRGSIFPDVELPRGISYKAIQYKELALEGDKWGSPIFDLKNTAPSPNSLETTEIVQKEDSSKSNDRKSSSQSTQGPSPSVKVKNSGNNQDLNEEGPSDITPLNEKSINGSYGNNVDTKTS